MMDALYPAEKEGALFIGVAAKGDDIVKLLAGELIHGFGTLPGDVDADLGQDANGHRVDLCSFSPGGKCLEAVAKVVVGQSFGQLGTAGVVSEKEKDALFHNGEYIRLSVYNKQKIRNREKFCCSLRKRVMRDLLLLREGWQHVLSEHREYPGRFRSFPC